MNKKKNLIIISTIFIIFTIFSLNYSYAEEELSLRNQLEELSQMLDDLTIIYEKEMSCLPEESFVKEAYCNETMSYMLEGFGCCNNNQIKKDCVSFGVSNGLETELRYHCNNDNLITNDLLYESSDKVCCKIGNLDSSIDGTYYSYEVLNENNIKLIFNGEIIFLSVSKEDKIYNISNDTQWFLIEKSNAYKVNSSMGKDDFLYKILDKNKIDILNKIYSESFFVYDWLYNDQRDIISATSDLDDSWNMLSHNFNKDINLSNKENISINVKEVLEDIKLQGNPLIKKCLNNYEDDFSESVYSDYIYKNSNSFVDRNYLNEKLFSDIKKDEYCYTIKISLKRYFLDFYNVKSGSQKFLENLEDIVSYDPFEKVCSSDFCKNDTNKDQLQCWACYSEETTSFQVQFFNSALLPVTAFVSIFDSIMEDVGWDFIINLFEDLVVFSEAEIPVDVKDFLDITGLSKYEKVEDLRNGETGVISSSDECWSISWLDLVDPKELINGVGTSLSCSFGNLFGIEKEDDTLSIILDSIDSFIGFVFGEEDFEFLSNMGEGLESISDVDGTVKLACDSFIAGDSTFSESFSFDDFSYNKGNIYINFMGAWNQSILLNNGNKINQYNLYLKAIIPYNLSIENEKICYIGDFYNKKNIDNFDNFDISLYGKKLCFKTKEDRSYCLKFENNDYILDLDDDSICFKNDTKEYCYPEDLKYSTSKIGSNTKISFISDEEEVEFSFLTNYLFTTKAMSINNNLICMENENNNIYSLLGPDQKTYLEENFEDNLKVKFIFFDKDNKSEILELSDVDFKEDYRKDSIYAMYSYNYFNESNEKNVFSFNSIKNFSKVCIWFNYDLNILKKGIYVESIALNPGRENNEILNNYPYCREIISAPIENGNNDYSNQDFNLNDKDDEDLESSNIDVSEDYCIENIGAC